MCTCVYVAAMPWYLSRRQISRLLRESRNSITHRLVGGEAFGDAAIGAFVAFSVVYAVVQTVEQVMRTRVMLANRLLIKRLVLERILYSEVGSLQQRYLAVFGEEVRTDQLEQHVFNDGRSRNSDALVQLSCMCHPPHRFLFLVLYRGQ